MDIFSIRLQPVEGRDVANEEGEASEGQHEFIEKMSMMQVGDSKNFVLY